MSNGPLKPCTSSGCGALVKSGRCDQHRKTYDKWRGSRHDRGYGSDWDKVRNEFMAKPENQLCKMCLRHGKYVLATDCDHIIPFKGKDDPLRLSPSNFQPLCKACNIRKSNA